MNCNYLDSLCRLPVDTSLTLDVQLSIVRSIQVAKLSKKMLITLSVIIILRKYTVKYILCSFVEIVSPMLVYISHNIEYHVRVYVIT